ncbi:MAG: hypothetical protein K2L15_00925, partial [Eubacteriales bacterium]|nr:hypothetical protein [Eubacteriales bacterium]
GYAKGFFNISGENLTYLVTNNGEIGDKFNKDEFGVQGCYFPSVLEIVESGMIEQEDKQPEFIYENTNLDSLEETMVSSLGTYGNSIRISTVSNLSVRNIGNIFADREETELFVEPFTLKGLIAPSAKTLFIANKNNFETLDDIINLPALEEITLLNTGISDISVLQNLDANQIKSLNLKGSKVADIGPIANLGNKLKSIDTTEQRVDYTAYKEADNSVKLVNVINDSSGELIKENSIKITGISNGGIYDADTNSISWENTDNSINAGDTLTFKFSANYEINGIEFEYSGTGTVNVDESANKPVSLQYDVQIVGANNQRVNYSQVDDFNTKLEEGVTLTGKDAGNFKLKVEGAVEKPVGGRKAVSKITYKAVKNDDESIVAVEKVRQIVVSNMDPVLNGINTSVYWKLGDEEIDFAQGITATDEEDGDIDVSKIKITKDFDFKDITDETKRTGKVTYSVTDSDGNTVTKTTTVYINYKGVKISEDLKVAVNKALGRNKKTEVLQEDLEKVTSINLDNATDLAGLE